MAAVGEPASTIDGPGGLGGPRENDLPPVPPAAGQNGGDLDAAHKQSIRQVLSSEIGITTLLNRLKQSISSTRDFAAFLKERAILEEKHANGLKRLAQNSHNSITRPESRQGSFAQGYQEIARSHERVADHGLTFSTTLYSMTDELHELATSSEKGRKHWKQTGLNAEKRVQDAQFAMEKAKAKYNSLAEQYDRVRTGERAGGKFGLKKSAAQEEENLHRKLEAADGDYSFKVQAAQTAQQELLTTLRPQAVNALQELIFEIDAGLGVHVQKFAAQSEKLLLGYGLSITPMKGPNPSGGPPTKSLRELASSINNDRDFADYILSVSNKALPRPNEIKYEQHPTLGPKQQTQNQYTQNYDDDSYYPTAHNRQVSSVTSYQDSSYEDSGYGYPGSGPQSQYQQGNQGSRSTQPPQSQQPQQRQASVDYPSAPSTAPSQPGSGAPPPTDGSTSDRFAGQTSGVISSVVPGGGPTSIPGQNDQTDQSSYGSSLGQANAPTGSAGPAPGAGARPPGAMRQPSSESRPGGAGPAPGPAGRGTGPPPGSQNTGGPGAGPRPTGPPQGAGRGAPGAGRGAPPGAGRGTPSGPGRGAPPGAGRGASGGPLGAGRGAPPGAGRGGPGSGPPSGAGARSAGAETSGAGRGAPTSRPSQGPSQPPPNGAPRSQGGPGPGPQNVAARPPGPGAGGPGAARGSSPPKTSLPPLKPVFGVSLDDLFQREGSAVPTIVYQCIQAVDLYGLDTEGIYRTSGSAHHIMELRQQFDHDSALVDFRNASTFHDDIASVTTLLKHFLRDLPEPLLTTESYHGYVQAAKLEDEIVRRDSIHALVNALPDPNYATLRVLALHLHRIAQRSDRNKMTISNLAIVFAPTLMGQQGTTNGQSNGMTADIADAGWQAKVVETILTNTLQIFDDDE
ncbi:uncharacterized protein A1O9_05889 [Exophiala aquamarina CBS 119918]|uniref:Rho-GAP domain-containing protein n=1 Tax=Exophiala aquamarina CBS 119918 TaxID=1182545 RepID=A0A072PDM5_9EURO|nr:uncharacterized protein A1O9_05889 [Exophiala aquamarina CBS 119918]KEF57966.1 hypothetical protein A1O9_05889 [Exophiala aquamarina CBS 119918]